MFLFFIENKIWHFMQIVSLAWSVRSYFLGKICLSSAEFSHSMESSLSIGFKFNLRCVAPGGGGFGGTVIGLGLESRKSSPPIANAGGSKGLFKDGILTLDDGGMSSVSGFTLMGELTMIGGDNGCCCWDDVKADGGDEMLSSFIGNDNRSSGTPSWSVTGTE